MIISPKGVIIPLNMAKNDDWRDLLNEIKLRYSVGDQEITGFNQEVLKHNWANRDFQAGELAFVLELKIREAQAARFFLEGLVKQALPARQAWLNDNQLLFGQLSKLIARDSYWSLTGLKHDQQTSALSLTLAEQLKTVMGLMNALVTDDNWLDG